jgi:hypothetical protein
MVWVNRIAGVLISFGVAALLGGERLAGAP